MELTVSYGENASSAMFDFASTIAPASLSRFTIVASSRGIQPRSASVPAVVCSPAVWKLSFTITGMQCSGPTNVREDDGVDRRAALVERVDARQVPRHDCATGRASFPKRRVYLGDGRFSEAEG